MGWYRLLLTTSPLSEYPSQKRCTIYYITSQWIKKPYYSGTEVQILSTDVDIRTAWCYSSPHSCLGQV